MLVGCIGTFDLRLLGLAKRIPMIALHRIIPWGISGYAINVLTGAMYLMGEPDQYIYNPSFQFKLAFMTIAGLNVLVFYTLVFGKIKMLKEGADAPPLGKIVGAVSLAVWIAVMVCGRLITFYRPFICGDGPQAFPLECIPHP
jgi:hypothetical protein